MNTLSRALSHPALVKALGVTSSKIAALSKHKLSYYGSKQHVLYNSSKMRTILSCCCTHSGNAAQQLVGKGVREAQLAKHSCNFCRKCGTAMEIAVPKGEDELRHVCPSCSYVEYLNPKMVVGCLVEYEEKVLLCRRALEPCAGLWTLPAGYLELHESTVEGAARETWEEAQAQVIVMGPYSHLDIPVIGQTYLIFRAALAPPFTYSAGPESMEVKLFSPDEIPFSSIAFNSISLTLSQWVDDKKQGHYTTRHGVIRKKPGASPSDPSAYSLTDTFHMPVDQVLK